MKTEHNLHADILKSLAELSSMREWIAQQAAQLAMDFWDWRKALQADTLAQRPRQHGHLDTFVIDRRRYVYVASLRDLPQKLLAAAAPK